MTSDAISDGYWHHTEPARMFSVNASDSLTGGGATPQARAYVADLSVTRWANRGPADPEADSAAHRRPGDNTVKNADNKLRLLAAYPSRRPPCAPAPPSSTLPA